MIRSFKSYLIVSGILAGALSTTRADGDYLPWEKGSVSVGGLISSFDSELTFGFTSGQSVELSGEDNLGMDSTLAVVRAEIMYRPGKSLRHQIDFSYAGFHRDGDATLSRSLTI